MVFTLKLQLSPTVNREREGYVPTLKKSACVSCVSAAAAEGKMNECV